MTQTEALNLALEALEKLTNAAEGFSVSGVYFNEELWARKCLDDAYDAMGLAQEALAQEKALQALHDENERLGLYKDAYAQPEEEKLHPVHIGVDVTKEGTAVTAFYRKPDAVMEMFYSQFHPMAQPEQAPVAYFNPQVKGGFYWAKPTKITAPVTVSVEPMPLYTTLPQRKPLTDEEIMNIAKVSCIGISPHEDTLNFAKVIEAVHGIKGDT